MIQLAPIVLSALAVTLPNHAGVVCQLPADTPQVVDGSWIVGEDRVHVKTWMCRGVNDFARTKRATYKAAWGLTVTAHELEHERNPDEDSEAMIECLALRDVPKIVGRIAPRRVGRMRFLSHDLEAPSLLRYCRSAGILAKQRTP
jgi:hypothetical protein